MNNDDIMNEKVICKWCGKETIYGDMIWLNGKCMCPSCYALENESESEKVIEND